MHELMVILDYGIEEPKVFGIFHIVCLIIMSAMISIVIWKRDSIDDKKFKSILLWIFGTMVVLEIYKQFTFAYDTSTRVWAYAWYIFPYQFCSTPMYVIPIVALIKDCKFKDWLMVFLATYGLFAGLSVMIVPSGVLTRAIGANIQTMYHHGAMVVVGVMMYACGKVRYEHKAILGAMYVFIVMAMIALGMNLVFHIFNTTNTFNMFYISPYFTSVIPILDVIQPNVPYIVFLFLYLGGFTGIAYLVLLVSWCIHKKYYEKSAYSRIIG